MADSSEKQQPKQQRSSDVNSSESPYTAMEPFIRQADPIQRDRLIDIRSTSYLAKEREMARREDVSVNWMFPPPRYSNPYPLAEVILPTFPSSHRLISPPSSRFVKQQHVLRNGSL
jgi:hypothetical protein